LRKAHTILAYLFFLTFLAHFAAILFHTLIVRDGILKRMAPWNIRPQETAVAQTGDIVGRYGDQVRPVSTGGHAGIPDVQ